jgi:formylglycine-generating enzyme required for sulfatase activity
MIHRLYDPNPPAGMAFMPAGLFTMGDTMGEGNGLEFPLHSVFVSAFYMDRHEVTKALWEGVFLWATNHGYKFEYGAQGKTNNHPVNRSILQYIAREKRILRMSG